MKKEWAGFKPGKWVENVNLRDFISLNYKPYDGNEEFLCESTKKTKDLFRIVQELQKEELKRGILGIDINNISGIDNFDPGYIDQENEIIVGLQTDAPFKRIINPYGGIRMVESAMHAYGHDVPNNLIKIFSQYTKTHNQGVFDAYTEEMKTARNVGLLTGLPDAYGRGRIVGDYRRIPLYGLDFLIKEKEHDFKTVTCNRLKEAIALREEISMQILALKQIKSMAGKYGFDLSVPATNAREAVQFLYFGYLAAIKQNNGAAMSLGRDTAFLDIYFERDMANGILTEEEAQEIIDQFVIKLRMVRHLRTNEYNELFAGDPAWVTEVIGGMAEDGKHMVTKTSYRFIHTLNNLSPSPEPNITILWSEQLPEDFKKYCAKVSIQTSSIQYENDDVMRPIYGDDYCIACCISALREGKEMQLFGARCNLAKSLLYAINGGMDELKKIKVIEGIEPDLDEVLDYDKVIENFDYVMDKVAEIYVGAMNVIHYMHDRYAYESSMMALHDSLVGRFMAFGVAGLSIVADSLSAIKYAKVKPVREDGIAIDFEIEGDYPQFGNDDDRVDLIAEEVVEKFIKALRKVPAYRGARHTLSVLTITSNVVYGQKTGSTPDGRKSGEPFAPGANPLHGRDRNGLLASLNSVAKLKYENVCEDGISNTVTIVPNAIGKIERHRIDNLVSILSGYFIQGGHHLNINVMDRETLLDAVEHPDRYPTLTIRVSGYAVNFNRLTREQQMEIIHRSFHDKI